MTALFLALMFGLTPRVAEPRLTLTLAWDANPPEDAVKGYRVHYGTAPGSHTQHVDVGNVTQTNFTLPDGPTYYFTVTAYNAAGDESGQSDEVNTADTPPGSRPPGAAGKPGIIKAPQGVQVQR